MALLAYTIYGAGITLALLAAFFWKRANALGAVASISSGTAATLLWEVYGSPHLDAVLPAVAVSVIAVVIGSYLGSPPAREKVEPFFAVLPEGA